MMDRILDIRRAGAVRRYHTEQMLVGQTVADHSWGVAMILLDMTMGCASANLLKAALYHDIAEWKTGDVPAPVKWEYPELKELLSKLEAEEEDRLGVSAPLTQSERTMLKVADMLELVFKCSAEYQLGNQRAREIAWAGMDYLEGLFPHMSYSVRDYCIEVKDTLFGDVDRG